MPSPKIPAVGRADNPMTAGLGSADSQPASPMEKYFTLKDSYARDGKPWDWEAMRGYVLDDYANNKNWPRDHWTMRQLAELQDSDMAMSPERARLIRLDDVQANREADAARDANIRRTQEARANALGEMAVPETAALKEELALLRQQNAEMMEKMNALLAGGVIPNFGPPEVAEDVPPIAAHTMSEQELKDLNDALSREMPTIAWTRRDLLAYADRKELKLTDRAYTSTASKAEILEAILAAMPEDAEPAEPEV